MPDRGLSRPGRIGSNRRGGARSGGPPGWKTWAAGRPLLVHPPGPENRLVLAAWGTVHVDWNRTTEREPLEDEAANW